MNMEKVKNALDAARHSLATLNGLIVYDGAVPGETWEIDERETARLLDEAIESFGTDKRHS